MLDILCDHKDSHLFLWCLFSMPRERVWWSYLVLKYVFIIVDTHNCWYKQLDHSYKSYKRTLLVSVACEVAAHLQITTAPPTPKKHFLEFRQKEISIWHMKSPLDSCTGYVYFRFSSFETGNCFCNVFHKTSCRTLNRIVLKSLTLSQLGFMWVQFKTSHLQ